MYSTRRLYHWSAPCTVVQISNIWWERCVLN